MAPNAKILVFWMLSFKPTFQLSSFTLIKRLFSSSSFSAIGVVSSAYLRLLIFLPKFLIPAYASFSLAFCMMYSAYKLNKQGDNIQLWHNSFPVWNQFVVPSLILTVASDLHTGFSGGRWCGLVFPLFVVILTVKGFMKQVNEAEVKVSSMSYCGWIAHFCLVLIIFHCLNVFVHLLKDIRVTSRFWRLWRKSIQTSCARFCGSRILTSLGKCQGA